MVTTSHIQATTHTDRQANRTDRTSERRGTMGSNSRMKKIFQRGTLTLVAMGMFLMCLIPHSAFAGWNYWNDLGGNISATPGCVSESVFKSDCLGQGTINQLLHKVAFTTIWKPSPDSNVWFWYFILKTHNSYRQQAGVAPLTWDHALAYSAKTVANQYSSCNGHPYLEQFWPRGIVVDADDIAPNNNTGWAGENLSCSGLTRSTTQMIVQWANSPDHYANIVNSHFTKVGCGLAGAYFVCRYYGPA